VSRANESGGSAQKGRNGAGGGQERRIVPSKKKRKEGEASKKGEILGARVEGERKPAQGPSRGQSRRSNRTSTEVNGRRAIRWVSSTSGQTGLEAQKCHYPSPKVMSVEGAGDEISIGSIRPGKFLTPRKPQKVLK